MSSQEEVTLKAGHPPAVKAGGMRVATRHRTSSGSEKVETPPKDDAAADEEFEEGEAKTDKHNQKVLISGALTKGDQDWKAEAVKHYHDKPQPSKDQRPVSKPNVIQQPR